MDLSETLKLAAEEDDLWYFKGLHAGLGFTQTLDCKRFKALQARA